MLMPLYFHSFSLFWLYIFTVYARVFSVCVCVFIHLMCRVGPQWHSRLSQRTTLQRQFSHYTFMWDPGTQLRSSGFSTYQTGALPASPSAKPFFFSFCFSKQTYIVCRTCWKLTQLAKMYLVIHNQVFSYYTFHSDEFLGLFMIKLGGERKK